MFLQRKSCDQVVSFVLGIIFIIHTNFKNIKMVFEITFNYLTIKVQRFKISVFHYFSYPRRPYGFDKCKWNFKIHNTICIRRIWKPKYQQACVHLCPHNLTLLLVKGSLFVHCPCVCQFRHGCCQVVTFGSIQDAKDVLLLFARHSNLLPWILVTLQYEVS